MKKRSIIIVGARIDGHAGVILDTIETIGTYEVVGFIDNTPELQDKKVEGIPVIGTTDTLKTMDIPADCVHIAIGDNVARGNLFKMLDERGVCVETIKHPSAQVSRRAKVNSGCFVGANAVINNGVVIGSATIINTGAIVEHDNIIGFAVHFAPSTCTAGRVIVDDYAFLGLGAKIIPDIHIGSAALIGAGSTVIKNVSDKTTVIGYAARTHVKNIYIESTSDTENN